MTVRKKIAIVGTGISGLLSAYLLARKHAVTVFESADRIGGHTATRLVETDSGRYAIDTGFIVYNDRTYPNFIKLMERLGVSGQKTQMGFSVVAEAVGLEYSGCSVNGLFAQRRQFFSASHWRMLRDILHFNRECRRLYERDAIPAELTLGEFVTGRGYSQIFQQYYLLPMVSAIWSAGQVAAAAMPLTFFIRFFYNHGLLTVFQQPQWYTLVGGSHSYLAPLTAGFADAIRTHTPVRGVRRWPDRVDILTSDQVLSFDEVVLACHSDQALALLHDPSAAESSVLGAIGYTPNEVVLHTDESILPASRRAWASWNYRLAAQAADSPMLTYNMNILQNIVSPETFCVSVNPGSRLREERVLGRYLFHHPLFTADSVRAQQRWGSISGVNRTHYCGAYWRNGFHEDGVVSALRVGESFGETL